MVKSSSSSLAPLPGGAPSGDPDDPLIVIPSPSLRQLYESPPSPCRGRQYAFCDFAAGRSENVLAHRIGNRVLPLLAWRETDTMAAIARFIREFKKRGLHPRDIHGDACGIGAPIIDRLAQLGWPIHRVQNAGTPRNAECYENRGAELWHVAANSIAARGIILPAADILHAQLTTRRMKILADGRLGLESKRDMAKRRLPSPDRADAVTGVIAIATPPITHPA